MTVPTRTDLEEISRPAAFPGSALATGATADAHRRPFRQAAAGAGLLPFARRARRLWLRAFDARQLPELDGERVAFRWFERRGEFADLAGKRIVEIGPKHGLDSRLLARLGPQELVLIDLPEKTALVREWLGDVEAVCPARFEEANLLYLSDSARQALGTFDLVWCLGVVYHNVEQFRLIRRLYELCNDGGRVVIESSTSRTRALRNRNVVELHWPRPFNDVPTITHLPSRLAVKTWLEMVGFTDVEVCDVYSRTVSKRRAVLTARKTAGAQGYLSYGASGLNPVYRPGEAT
jgi:2-polyprenyl-3-methyl-5-hydroxy-6-metoxy-1,4-benzoquinol methylase